MWTAVFILVIGIGTCAGLFWHQRNSWGPRKKQEMMLRKPLLELQQWGFQLTEYAFVGELRGRESLLPLAFVDTVNGYLTEVSFGWTDRPHFLVRVFFDPGSRDYDVIMRNWALMKEATKAWKFGESFFCAPAYVDAHLSYNIQPPAACDLVRLAEEMSLGLAELGKVGIAYEQGCALAETIIETSKVRSLAVNRIKKI